MLILTADILEWQLFVTPELSFPKKVTRGSSYCIENFYQSRTYFKTTKVISRKVLCEDINMIKFGLIEHK